MFSSSDIKDSVQQKFTGFNHTLVFMTALGYKKQDYSELPRLVVKWVYFAITNKSSIYNAYSHGNFIFTNAILFLLLPS